MAHGLLQWRVTCGWSSVTWGECDKLSMGKGVCLLAFHCLISEPFPEAKDCLPQGQKPEVASSSKYGSLLDLFQSGN